MKARVKETYYTSAFNEGEIVEIIPNMEADAADVFNVPAGKCFLCKKEDGTLIRLGTSAGFIVKKVIFL